MHRMNMGMPEEYTKMPFYGGRTGRYGAEMKATNRLNNIKNEPQILPTVSAG
ncbi:MAG: hypothetical protein PHS47_00885 [Methanocellales archaeon]|nr:hypothetical protein [Methanocellales archaeon]MDD3420843.1 hypothetical protein [Methanocellales archaeon]MDD4898014.1 hypothetical protein [Methanocellales archaeon]MDD5446489.1 hypothetical protein [Methanocellales archaeon]